MSEEVVETVDEYPCPPRYYSHFYQQSDRTMWPTQPRIIPNHEAYGGSVYVQSIAEQGFDVTKDYKKILHRELDKLLQESLSIISDVPSKTNASVRIGALNQTIGTIHTLLTEYRVHEAREQLCLELEKESQELDVILSDMNEVLQRHKHLASAEGASLMELETGLS